MVSRIVSLRVAPLLAAVCAFSALDALSALAGPPLDETAPVTGVVERYILSQRAFASSALRTTEEINGQQAFLFDLTSQFRDDGPWTHTLAVVEPPTGPTAVDDEAPSPDGLCVLWLPPSTITPGDALRIVADTAARLRVPCATLDRVPPGDASVNASLRRFAETGDPDAPFPIPMARATISAMDAIEAWSADRAHPINRFVLVGSGVRAWGAMIAAAVDVRAVGVMSLGFDLAHLSAQPPGAVPLLDGLPSFESPRGIQLAALVDPALVLARSGCPLWVVRGLGDQSFPADSLDRYAWDLKVPLRASLRGREGASIADSLPLAELALLVRWSDDPALVVPGATLAAGDASVILLPERDTGDIESVRLWSATSTSGDFANATWKSEPMARDIRRWLAARPIVPEGHTHLAFFGELIVAGPHGSARVTTVPMVVAGRIGAGNGGISPPRGRLFLPPPRRPVDTGDIPGPHQ